MLIIYAFILAVVQALSEFLPISSSGHLLILHNILNFDFADNLTFDVALHLGTLIALIVFFKAEIRKYFEAFINLFRRFNLEHDEQKTVLNLMIAVLPAFAAGFFLGDWIESMFRNLLTVAIALILGGILLSLTEWFSKKIRQYEGFSFPEAFLIGVAQVLALIPGVSRSGITIIAGLAINLKREEAAKFTFLLSIPTVLGAGLKTALDLQWFTLTSQDYYLMVFGIVVSALVGFFIIKYFLQFLVKHSLHLFSIYRIILGALILVYLFWK